MLKYVGRAYFPMRYQVSSPGYPRVRSKLDFGGLAVTGFSKAECKPKVPADAARTLRGLIPHSNRLGYRNNSYKEQEEQYDQLLSFLRAVGFKACNIPLHELKDDSRWHTQFNLLQIFVLYGILIWFPSRSFFNLEHGYTDRMDVCSSTLIIFACA